jgi:hypothetical protein
MGSSAKAQYIAHSDVQMEIHLAKHWSLKKNRRFTSYYPLGTKIMAVIVKLGIVHLQMHVLCSLSSL